MERFWLWLCTTSIGSGRIGRRLGSRRVVNAGPKKLVDNGV